MFNRTMIGAGAAILFGFIAIAKDSGFDGKWVVDKKASSANFDIPDELTQRIKTTGSGLAFQSTWREPKNGLAPLPLLGIMVTDATLATGGREERNQVGPFVQVTRTTLDGNRIVTEYNAASEEGKTVAGRWTRTLSGDGKQMTLEITQTGAGQNAEGKLVFRRK